MKYPRTLIIAALFCRTAMAAPEPVTCDSPCDCHNAHGEGRWSVKTDPSLAPTDASVIQAVTPSEMFGWPGSDAALTMQSERTGIVKYLQNRSGVRFARPFLVGLPHGFLFTLALRRS